MAHVLLFGMGSRFHKICLFCVVRRDTNLMKTPCCGLHPGVVQIPLKLREALLLVSIAKESSQSAEALQNTSKYLSYRAAGQYSDTKPLLESMTDISHCVSRRIMSCSMDVSMTCGIYYFPCMLTTIKYLIPQLPFVVRLRLLLPQHGQVSSRKPSSVHSRPTASKHFVHRTPCSLHEKKVMHGCLSGWSILSPPKVDIHQATIDMVCATLGRCDACAKMTPRAPC